MDKKTEKEVERILQEAHEEVQKKLKNEKIQTEVKEIKILENNKIEETPFTIVKTNESNKYFVICGKTRILTDYENLEDVVEKFKQPTFENITFLIEAVINILKEN